MTLRRSCIAVQRLNHWAFACEAGLTSLSHNTNERPEIVQCFVNMKLKYVVFSWFRSQCLFCAAAFLSTTRIVVGAVVYSINNNNKWRMIKEKITRIMRAFAWQKTNVCVPLLLECIDATDDAIHYSIFIYCFVTRSGRAHISVRSRETQRPSLD